MGSGTQSEQVVGLRLEVTTCEALAAQILAWAARRESRYVCFANVHMVMEAYDDATLRKHVNEADVTTPDGMPLVWCMKLLGHKRAQRVYGPDSMCAVLSAADRRGLRIGFLGGAPAVLDRLVRDIRHQFSSLRVAYCYAPPFRELTEVEEELIVSSVNKAEVQILFIGLGCPKQERWMARHRGSVQAVMLGVGAAFDFLAGTKPQAPRWMMSGGLEWAFRLATEPRRLWRRYLKHNPRFVYLFARQLLRPSAMAPR